MQLLTKIQILNNCMFGKLKNISVYFLNVTQNYVKQAKYINSTSSREFEECLDKAGEYTVKT